MFWNAKQNNYHFWKCRLFDCSSSIQFLKKEQNEKKMQTMTLIKVSVTFKNNSVKEWYIADGPDNALWLA